MLRQAGPEVCKQPSSVAGITVLAWPYAAFFVSRGGRNSVTVGVKFGLNGRILCLKLNLLSNCWCTRSWIC